MLGLGGTGPQILPRFPKFLVGSIVGLILLSRCCLPNDEGRASPPNIFFLEPSPVINTQWCSVPCAFPEASGDVSICICHFLPLHRSVSGHLGQKNETRDN